MILATSNTYTQKLSSGMLGRPAWSAPRLDGPGILVTPDQFRWRIEQWQTVGDLVHVGDTIRTNYNTGGCVIRVAPNTYCCCPYDEMSSKLCVATWRRPMRIDYHRTVTAWEITYVAHPERARRDKHGRFYWTEDHSYLSELVAVGDRILKLFENNTDEVFLSERGAVDIPVQLNLFGGS